MCLTMLPFFHVFATIDTFARTTAYQTYKREDVSYLDVRWYPKNAQAMSMYHTNLTSHTNVRSDVCIDIEMAYRCLFACRWAECLLGRYYRRHRQE